MTALGTEAEMWKEAILIYFDNAYSNGIAPDAILIEVKDIVSTTELGEMNFTLESIMAEWKADRRIA